jgi:succinyl-diaminopimelate desuccinylase
MNDKIIFLSDLIRYQSITPFDQECQKIISDFLLSLGFKVTNTQEDNVSNLFATNNTNKPIFAFIGHTDVVAPGNLDKWNSNPFEPIIKDGFMFGRGTADMKGNLTAFLFAVKKFISQHPKHNGSISILLTSGEEGNECHNGIPKIIPTLPYNQIEYCLVGEPTSNISVGDVIKVGRRGSLSGKVCIQGTGGHVAYPHSCKNPIHLVPAVIQQLQNIKWDDQDEIFDSTSLQLTNIYVPNSSNNVIPDKAYLEFNLRFSPNISTEKIKSIIEKNINKEIENVSISWNLFGNPYFSSHNKLFLLACQIINETKNITPIPSTSGGTSDGRYIANICQNIIELGCTNSTIHKPNERICLTELDEIELIYYKLLENTLL